MQINKNLIIDAKGLKERNEVFEIIESKVISLFPQIKKGEIVKGFKSREEVSSTGFENGIAIPHTKVSNLEMPEIVIVKGLDVVWPSMDGNNTELAISILVPKSGDDEHLKILSKLSRKLIDLDFIKELKKSSEEECKTIIDSILEDDKDSKEKSVDNKGSVSVVAVSACTTGIAHTYMAEESLIKSAKKLGVNIKVETRGQGGVENELTAEDIKNADYVLLTTDIQVPTDRFYGKKILQKKVKAGVHDSELLLTNFDEYTVFNSQNTKVDEESGESNVYKYLMNGVTHMLPFTVAGGILTALGFFFGTKANIAVGVNPIIDIPAIGEFSASTGSILMGLMIPILAAYIAYAIGNRAALMPGFLVGMLAVQGGSGFIGAIAGAFVVGFLSKKMFGFVKKIPKGIQGSYQILFIPLILAILASIGMLIINVPSKFLNDFMVNGLQTIQGYSPLLLGVIAGGMMAVDMGGPINKAAYVTGTLLLSQGNYTFMAAVMAGGMVPPLSIAMATTFAKHKFSDEEIELGKTNWLLGLSFVTEGAIPFVASNIKIGLISCITGSSVAGALTMQMGIELMAPHGGIFVLPLVNSPLLYVLAILVGSIVSAVILVMLKKGE